MVYYIEIFCLGETFGPLSFNLYITYESCVENRVVNDTKCTIVWHLDDLKTHTSCTWEVPQRWVWIFRQAKQAM